VKSVLADVDTSAFDDRHKALFRFLDKVNERSPEISAEDLAVTRAAGWTDEELFFAVTVCALFNFYNRWIDATGVHAMSAESHRQGAKRMASAGYGPR
jgi:alkylhydroperoxidase family enzyme